MERRKVLDGRAVARLQRTLGQQSIRLMQSHSQSDDHRDDHRSDDVHYDDNRNDRDRNKSRPSNKRPPGLKGKDIGLFYRNRSLRHDDVRNDDVHYGDNQSDLDHNKTKPSHSRPPGLKGKEIGLFYRNRSLKSQALKDLSCIESEVIVPINTIQKVEELLNETSKLSNATPSSEFQQKYLNTLSTTFDEFLKSTKVKVEESRNENVDEHLLANYLEMTSRPIYFERLAIRTKLPAYQKRDEILKYISDNQVVLISGDTGCGKTTQVPQFILDEFVQAKNGSVCNIFCTQPRRISAITVAERVAWERAEQLGSSVGYQIRLESKRPRERGSIIFCTTGILLKRMESDPLLEDITHIVLDEIHERDINTDIIIGLLKQVCRYRTDLKIILMSATFSTATFSQYFDNCKIIQIEGTLFPVEEKYLEDILEEIKFNNFPEGRPRGKEQRWQKKNNRFDDDFASFIEPYARSIQNQYSKGVIKSIQNRNSEEINIDLLCDLIFHISHFKPDGAILVFLPGYDKISKLHTELMNSKYYSDERFRLFALHSMMPTSDQRAVFANPPPNVRKIILATNIAETSITIDDVVYVINSGKIKLTNYHIETNLQALEECWATLANVKQRKGRAGRVKSGTCYHMYTRAREYTLEQFPVPEILRTRLESVILNIKMLRINDVEEFFSSLLSTPHEVAVERGIILLRRLNALDENELLTPLGLHLARLPLDPQTGKMILMASIFKCIDPITTVAANLSFKDAFYRPLGKETIVDGIRLRFAQEMRSDHLMMANVMDEFKHARASRNENSFCYNNFLSCATLKQLEKMKEQFCELLFNEKFITSSNYQNSENNRNSSNLNLLRAIIASGLYPNIAKLKKVKHIKNWVGAVLSVVTPEDGKVQFHPSSTNSTQRNFDSKFFVYYMKQKSKAIYLFDSTMVDPLSLLIFGDGVYKGVESNGVEFIAVANKFKFQTNKATSTLILRLRKELEALLQRKALHPSPIDLDNGEGNLIKAIVQVLSTEKFSEDDTM